MSTRHCNGPRVFLQVASSSCPLHEISSRLNSAQVDRRLGDAGRTATPYANAPLTGIVCPLDNFGPVAKLERRTRRCRNRDSPTSSFAADKPNSNLNSAGFDDPFLALGVPVDALARLGRHTGLISGRDPSIGRLRFHA